jgi:predicted kinase
LGGEVWKAGLENCSASHRWLSIFPNGVKRRKGTLRRRFVKERLPVATLTTPRVCENALSAKDECTKERAPEMGAGHLLRCRKLCYIHIMREWMRALMRRRGKRGVNDSESTGKIGQEIPANQPTPLQPMYPEDKRGRAAEPAVAGLEQDAAQLVKKPAGAPETSAASAVARSPQPSEAPAAEVLAAQVASPVAPFEDGKLVVETQPESPSVPPPEQPSAGQKDLKGYVVLAIGLPGSGKTTWFKRRGVTPLSSDMLRSILFDDITEQRYQGLVFSTLRSLLRARLIAKMPWNYVDATNLSAHERRQWIKVAKSFGYEAQAVFFDVPLEVCMERNSRRERTVSDDVMRKMAERLRPPSFKEGFSKITMVRVKGAPPIKMDGIEVEPPSS